MVLPSELKEYGLNDKEAAVYLAALSLGPSPVQNIARKARVARATTYVVLGALMQRGFVAKYYQGKKTMFVAEHPSQLRRLLAEQEAVLTMHRRALITLVPRLEALMKSMGDRPLVRYYTGVEGLRAIRAEMAMYCAHGDTWYSLAPVDSLLDMFGQKEFLYYRQRCARGIKTKTIFSTQSPVLKQKMLADAVNHAAERKYIPMDRYASQSGMTIFKDRVAIGHFNRTSKVGGLIIESTAIASMMQELFTLAWGSI